MAKKDKKIESVSTSPVGMQVIIREFKKDKLAMLSFFLLVITIGGIFIYTWERLGFIDQDTIMRVSLRDKFSEPGEKFILGADLGGREILGQLLIGARNSMAIAMAITLITCSFGILVGLICGYFGGWIDNLFMRIIDFFMTIPSTMIIIVFITIVPVYNKWTFIAIMSLFLWTGTARLVRAKALTESRRDYVNASKTVGTRNIVIILKEIMPNLSSILIVELTLNFAGNVGIETGLSFLNFGLPPTTPSLGTLVAAAMNPIVLSEKWWVWMPAAALILFFMLAINYVGQALRRSADVRQRLG